MFRRSVLFGGVLSLVGATLAPAASADECDAACKQDLRERIIREIRALNDGQVWA